MGTQLSPLQNEGEESTSLARLREAPELGCHSGEEPADHSHKSLHICPGWSHDFHDVHEISTGLGPSFS